MQNIIADIENQKYKLITQYNIDLQILKPMLFYGTQVWSCSSDRDIKSIHTFQNKVLRKTFNAPWYVRNSADHYRDLGLSTVKQEVKRLSANMKSGSTFNWT